MTTMVRDLPQDERPREKLLTFGAGLLTNAELLAILLRTGSSTRSVLHVADDILARLDEKRGIVDVVRMTAPALCEIDGVGPAKAATVLAAIELGRRLGERTARERNLIRTAKDAAEYAMPTFRDLVQECVYVMLLDVRHRVVQMQHVTTGGLTQSIAQPRDIFRVACATVAQSMILLHNHPSGDPTPSPEDIQMTHRMIDAGRIMGIPVVDHVILGDECYYSLQEHGYLNRK